jgi:hypothetical protein
MLSLSIRSLSLFAELSPDAIKVLEKSREGWLAARSQDFPKLLLMTKLVALGVILEGPELVYELWKVIRRWKQRVVPDHAPSWITLIGLVGWLLVAVGVAGEFWVDGKVNSDDENIQSINITLLEDASASASQAKSDANSAHDLAQSASDIAGSAKTTSGEAKGEALVAERQADAVGEKTDDLDRQLDAAKKQLADAEEAEKKEEQTLINMGVCLAPRIIPHWNGPNGNVVDPLRPYAASYHAIVEYVPDPEARRAALNLVEALIDAGWKATFVRQIDGLNDGVEIEPYHPVPGKPTSFFQIDQERKSSEVADAFVDFLHSNNWQASTVLKDFDLSPNAIKIKIGLYPPTEYMAPPGAAQYTSWADDLEKKFMAERKQLEARAAEAEEKLLAQLPPEQAERSRALIKQQDEERKKIDERFSQPCRAADGFAPPPLQ